MVTFLRTPFVCSSNRKIYLAIWGAAVSVLLTLIVRRILRLAEQTKDSLDRIGEIIVIEDMDCITKSKKSLSFSFISTNLNPKHVKTCDTDMWQRTWQVVVYYFMKQSEFGHGITVWSRSMKYFFNGWLCQTWHKCVKMHFATYKKSLMVYTKVHEWFCGPVSSYAGTG